MRPDPDELRRVPLFAELPPAAAEQVATWLEERHVEAGDRLTPEGASGYTFFVIFEGSAAVSCDGAAIADLGPGDFFGEGALLGSTGRRNASVVASSPMRVATMFGTEFRRLEQELPYVAAQLRETMAARDAEHAAKTPGLSAP